VVLWLVASGYLVFIGFYDREVANGVRQVSIPAVTGLSSIQRERRLSVAYLSGPGRTLQGLIDQRRQTDQRLSTLRTAAESALALAPESIKTRWKALTGYLDQLPGIRSLVDSGSADRQHVYDFYNGLLDSATGLFDTQARVVPDVTATQGGIAATETFRVSDVMSRAGSIIAGAFGSRRLSRDDYLEFVRLVGAYHAQLTDVAPHFRPDVQKRYEGLVASASWKSLVAAENELIADGPWHADVPRGLPVNATSWEALTTEVSDNLIDLTIAQADEVSAEALNTGNNQLLTALLGSLIALAIAGAAIAWSIRQSQALVDRALSIRLGQLGSDAVAVVDQRLPDMLDRLRRREKIDLAVELPRRDYGQDEIGELADVLNRSLQVAVGAAVEEATTRAAGVAMLMGVARRPQRPLQRGLQVIEDLQSRIGDEELLAELFDINHQLAQTRRFLENLIILAGGQTGRRFHKPVPMRRVLLAAIGETQQYQRITIRRTDDVALVGSAVAGTTHLLAELLDNALAFSPPGSAVWVSCSHARRGVVVEIEDAGVGMLPEDLERANELLATAPTPDVTALRDGSQVGLWVVAELAKRGGMQVTLRTSAYGGLLAIVLLPDRLIATGAELRTVDTADAAPTLFASAAGPGPRSAPPATVAFLPGVPSAANGDGRHELRPTAAPVIATGGVDLSGARRPVPDLPTGEGRRIDSADGMMNDPRPNSTAADLLRPESSLSQVVSASLPDPHPAPRPPLPERQPQEHLAPELRDDNATGDVVWEPAEPARSPEETRERIARYQQGWRAGRTDGTYETPTANDQDRKV
jgi:signal transduction histidine kinase